MLRKVNWPSQATYGVSHCSGVCERWNWWQEDGIRIPLTIQPDDKQSFAGLRDTIVDSIELQHKDLEVRLERSGQMEQSLSMLSAQETDHILE
jgi:hypothetical protein